MPWYDSFDTLCKERFPVMEVLREEPMSLHTTMRVGGPAKRLVRPGSTEELTALLDAAEAEGWPYMLLGNGSDLLVADEGLPLLVIHTGRLGNVENAGERGLRAQAGVPLARFAANAQQRALTGLEFAHGIPGTLGGAVMMNAGAYGGEMADVIRSVLAWFPGEGVRELAPEELHFGYRHSLFSEKRGVVLEALVELAPGDGEEIKAKMADLMARRREKQPLDMPSAGSTFKRPPNAFAAALIDQCGLRGTRVGGAQVSEKHAGFVVNAGGATCRDILALMELIRETVLRETGISLEPEVKLVP